MTEAVDRIADTISPMKRPRMNWMRVPSGTMRKRGRMNMGIRPAAYGRRWALVSDRSQVGIGEASVPDRSQVGAAKTFVSHRSQIGAAEAFVSDRSQPGGGRTSASDRQQPGAGGDIPTRYQQAR